MLDNFSPEKRQEKIKKQEETMKVLHDQKSVTSDPFFKDCKVTSCSQVLIKNG